MKKTNVNPKDIPQMCNFPSPRPVDIMRDSMITACKAVCSKNKFWILGIPQKYQEKALTEKEMCSITKHMKHNKTW